MVKKPKKEAVGEKNKGGRPFVVDGEYRGSLGFSVSPRTFKFFERMEKNYGRGARSRFFREHIEKWILEKDSLEKLRAEISAKQALLEELEKECLESHGQTE